MKVNDLLSKRLIKGDTKSKMSALAERTTEGSLTTFSGIFAAQKLSDRERNAIQDLLNTHAEAGTDVSEDLRTLLEITSEIKAINNQAALLHGERIKRVQSLLKSYKEGAFTVWLLETYGNRQTPYNFLQYYEFYETLPQMLRPLLESMPRQAIYTLATRGAPFTEKQNFIEQYSGETKEEILQQIRERFPLRKEDKRRENSAEIVIRLLRRSIKTLRRKDTILLPEQKKQIRDLLETVRLLTTTRPEQ